MLSLPISTNEVLLIDRRRATALLPSHLVITPNPTGVVVKAGKGIPCSAACALYQPGYDCDNVQMEFVNECNRMKRFFPCERGCWNEVGNDIPAYVESGERYGGMCLVSVDSFPLCDSANKGTQRLCMCVQKDSIVNYGIKTPVVKVSKKKANSTAKQHAVFSN